MLIEKLEDLATLTNSELDELYLACIREDERRRATITYLQQTLPSSQQQPLQESTPNGDPSQTAEFIQPTGTHDAYNIGALVSFKGTIYESLLAANVWSPTAYPRGWLKHEPDQNSNNQKSEPEPEAEADLILPVWASGLPVQSGEKYVYENQTFEVLQAHTTQADWTPPATPALWKPIE